MRRAILLSLVAAAIPSVAFLKVAGQFLAVADPLQRSDVVLVLAGARTERWLEGAELYREGWAPLILLSPGRLDPGEDELRRRGVSFPTDVDLIRTALVQFGVPAEAIASLPGSVDNTAQEAAAARRLATKRGWRRIIVVTSSYHGRRVRFAFVREFVGTPVMVIVRGSRFDRSTPRRWWQHRPDVRAVTSELLKLLLYRLGLRE